MTLKECLLESFMSKDLTDKESASLLRNLKILAMLPGKKEEFNKALERLNYVRKADGYLPLTKEDIKGTKQNNTTRLKKSGKSYQSREEVSLGDKVKINTSAGSFYDIGAQGTVIDIITTLGEYRNVVIKIDNEKKEQKIHYKYLDPIRDEKGKIKKDLEPRG